MKKHLYLVKREVLATSAEKALKAKGKVYCIELAEDKLQPEEKKPPGFRKSND